MKNTKSRHPVGKKTCITLRDWYMFVDKPQRTTVDGKFNGKLSEAVTIMIQQPETYDTLFISSTEAQMAARWYYMIPEVIRDKYDARVLKQLEKFIAKQG